MQTINFTHATTFAAKSQRRATPAVNRMLVRGQTRADHSWNLLNQTFSCLPEADKREIGARIGSVYQAWKAEPDYNKLSAAVRSELERMIQADITARWATDTAGRLASWEGVARFGKRAPAVLDSLRRLAHGYVVNRADYLFRGGCPGL
ncbi:MAG: hypothetical protein KC910_01390 [Candidatus Eremiobacteraeota bacterium]|nr:hypothetical protein [Candidatus Eremiobacteraeota bacterium]